MAFLIDVCLLDWTRITRMHGMWRPMRCSWRKKTLERDHGCKTIWTMVQAFWFLFHFHLVGPLLLGSKLLSTTMVLYSKLSLSGRYKVLFLALYSQVLIISLLAADKTCIVSMTFWCAPRSFWCCCLQWDLLYSVQIWDPWIYWSMHKMCNQFWFVVVCPNIWS